MLIGQFPRHPSDRRGELAAEGTAVGQWTGRLTPGLAPCRVGLEVGGFDPGRAKYRVPEPGGASRGGTESTVVRRPWTFPTSWRTSWSVSATTHRPDRSGTATRAPAGAASAAKPPCPSATPLPTACTDRPSMVALSAARSVRRGGSSLPNASHASITVCHPVHRQRCAASDLVTRSVSVVSAERSPENLMMIPGVQNPHWLPPVRVNASGPIWSSRRASRPSGSSRSGLPRAGRVSRTRPWAARRPARCNSRTVPVDCSRPWVRSPPTDHEGRRAVTVPHLEPPPQTRPP